MVRTAGLHPLLGEHSASPQPVARKQWELATWLSGDYHDRIFTGKLTAPSRRTSLWLDGAKLLINVLFLVFERIATEFPTNHPIIFWNFIEYYGDGFHGTFHTTYHHIRYALSDTSF
jgi:hypothetical protein